MKKFLILLISVFIIISIFVFLPKKKTIAVFNLFTNDLESYPREAIETAIKNGIGKNFKIVYIPYDSVEREEVRSIFKTSLNKYKFKYFIHATSSTIFSYIDDIVKEKKIFGIGSTVTSPKVIGKNPYFYSISISDDLQSKLIAKEISKSSTSVLIIKSDKNSVYINTYINLFLKNFNGKYEITNYQNINLNNKINAVLLLLEPKNAALAVQKIKNIYPNALIYGSDYIDNEQFREYGGSSIKGTKIFLLYNRDYAKKTIKDNKYLNTSFINTYDSYSFLTYLINKYHSPENISKNIRGETFTGLGGKFKINKQGFTEREPSFLIIK
ncbi:hypothetical protein OSSY52_21420 [Tepiditoga spiralis]|uniref:Leucine-binding protein domain-containing protein n=1 Tax=Tepiditoga spiralis TaxID=2108365 RepID=A0A7G1G6D8_9BACT|nr:ABC transporter substrate-binding protein [Tepiditoga spiralis]BBE32001.1 hypothetical protein OSSY52_21420 [Tepiditoga spiralis]